MALNLNELQKKYPLLVPETNQKQRVSFFDGTTMRLSTFADKRNRLEKHMQDLTFAHEICHMVEIGSLRLFKYNFGLPTGETRTLLNANVGISLMTQLIQREYRVMAFQFAAKLHRVIDGADTWELNRDSAVNEIPQYQIELYQLQETIDELYRYRDKIFAETSEDHFYTRLEERYGLLKKTSEAAQLTSNPQKEIEPPKSKWFRWR